MQKKRIPVILDTDIGGDIDDTWALAMLLNSLELDVKLVVSDTADTIYRAKLIAKLLEVGGRTDVPVGVGLRQNSDGPRERQAAWVKDYELARYPGVVHEDGVAAIVDTILRSPETMTLICIGPVPNISEALRREPSIAAKARFVGMHGSVYRGYEGKPGAVAEYNVKQDIPACQATFAAPWVNPTITPLDTCGTVRLTGERYARVRDSRAPLPSAVIENYRLWAAACGWPEGPKDQSSILFDTVAVHLAYSTRFLKMKRMGIRIDNQGVMTEDARARPIDVAVDWTDDEGYLDFLVERLLA